MAWFFISTLLGVIGMYSAIGFYLMAKPLFALRAVLCLAASIGIGSTVARDEWQSLYSPTVLWCVLAVAAVTLLATILRIAHTAREDAQTVS